MNGNKRYIIGLIILASVAGIILYYRQPNLRQPNYQTTVEYDLSSVAHRESSLETLNLGENLLPPTNSWLSSIVFSNNPVVFAAPFSAAIKNDSITLGVPRISASSSAVFGPQSSDITLRLPTDNYLLTDHDDLSATTTFRKQSDDLLQMKLSQGSPYIFLTASSDVNFSLSTEDSTMQQANNTIWFEVNKQRYGVLANNQTAAGSAINIDLKIGDRAVIFAIPNNATDTDSYNRLASNYIDGATVEHQASTDAVDTTFNFSAQTLWGSLPHFSLEQANPELGSFDTLYGPLVMHSGDSFKASLPASVPEQELNLSKLSDQQKQQLKIMVDDDIAKLTFKRTDTYFAGKELYKAANLLMLARQLELTDSANMIQKKLGDELATWLKSPSGRDDRFFYYDDTIKGIVGVDTAFGSEVFNDHHFHYGYFIYAAAVMAETDSTFIDNYGQVVDLLVADIASNKTSQQFPKFRNFDAFTGHSWASGFADFADGNNQESSSEATNAWAAVYKWASVRQDAKLQNDALLLYSNETQAATNYWLNSDYRNQFTPYRHNLVSLLWGGKRDYATFFSPRPQAQLGIQLIPLSPAHAYLADTNISAQLQEATPSDKDFNGQFGDYLVMYEALINPSSALQKAQKIADNDFDEANSKSYMYAWIYSQL